MLLYKKHIHRYVDTSGHGIVKDLEFCINDWPNTWPQDLFLKDIVVKPKDRDVEYTILHQHYNYVANRIAIEFTYKPPHMRLTFIDNTVLDVIDLVERTDGRVIQNWQEVINLHNNSLAQGIKFYDEIGDIDFDIITNKEFRLGCDHEISDITLSREDDSFNHWFYCKKKDCGAWLKRL